MEQAIHQLQDAIDSAESQRVVQALVQLSLQNELASSSSPPALLLDPPPPPPLFPSGELLARTILMLLGPSPVQQQQAQQQTRRQQHNQLMSEKGKMVLQILFSLTNTYHQHSQQQQFGQAESVVTHAWRQVAKSLVRPDLESMPISDYLRYVYGTLGGSECLDVLFDYLFFYPQPEPGNQSQCMEERAKDQGRDEVEIGGGGYGVVEISRSSSHQRILLLVVAAACGAEQCVQSLLGKRQIVAPFDSIDCSTQGPIAVHYICQFLNQSTETEQAAEEGNRIWSLVLVPMFQASRGAEGRGGRSGGGQLLDAALIAVFEALIALTNSAAGLHPSDLAFTMSRYSVLVRKETAHLAALGTVRFLIGTGESTTTTTSSSSSNSSSKTPQPNKKSLRAGFHGLHVLMRGREQCHLSALLYLISGSGADGCTVGTQVNAPLDVRFEALQSFLSLVEIPPTMVVVDEQTGRMGRARLAFPWPQGCGFEEGIVHVAERDPSARMRKLAVSCLHALLAIHSVLLDGEGDEGTVDVAKQEGAAEEEADEYHSRYHHRQPRQPQHRVRQEQKRHQQICQHLIVQALLHRCCDKETSIRRDTLARISSHVAGDGCCARLLFHVSSLCVDDWRDLFRLNLAPVRVHVDSGADGGASADEFDQRACHQAALVLLRYYLTTARVNNYDTHRPLEQPQPWELLAELRLLEPDEPQSPESVLLPSVRQVIRDVLAVRPLASFFS